MADEYGDEDADDGYPVGNSRTIEEETLLVPSFYLLDKHSGRDE